jgi:predicted DNA-binding protein
MATKKQPRKARTESQPRASVTFPPEQYEILMGLAKQKKVSIAWVVREAVDKYVADKWPLFTTHEGTLRHD